MRKGFTNENSVEKEVVLKIRVPQTFDEELEHRIDESFADVLYDFGCELIDSKEYRDISETGHQQKKTTASVSLGESVFMQWLDIDKAVNRWANSYFGAHVYSEGSRDESAFEVNIYGLQPSDHVKFAELFNRYDTAHDYDPNDELTAGNTYTTLPSIIARGVTKEALPGINLPSFGTAIALYDGVLFIEKDINSKDSVRNSNIFEVTETPESSIPKEDTVWICVYKDTLGFPDDFDNITYILVPTEWLMNELQAKGRVPEEWFNEYTADSTDDMCRKALDEGIILDCSDETIKSSLLNKTPSLDNIIQDAQTRTSSQSVSNQSPIKESGFKIN